MEQKHYIGFDLGTSGLRGLLVCGDGTPIASTEMSYPSQQPHRGWSEQDPSLWRAAYEGVVTRLRDLAPEAWGHVAGIGVSGHMHGAVLLDAADHVIRPCIVWNDTRSHEEATAFDAINRVRDLSGNIVFPGFTAPKLMWVAKNEPENFAKLS